MIGNCFTKCRLPRDGTLNFWQNIEGAGCTKKHFVSFQVAAQLQMQATRLGRAPAEHPPQMIVSVMSVLVGHNAERLIINVRRKKFSVNVVGRLIWHYQKAMKLFFE
jgi:hypothetical protein